MYTEEEADDLIKTLKLAIRSSAFEWDSNQRYDEIFNSKAFNNINFILSLKRNLFEIRLHIRTKKHNIGLMRVDAAPLHINPDGSEVRNQPHIHIYKEGYELDWAYPIDWYDVKKPLDTLDRFLDQINGKFPNGIQPILEYYQS